MNQIAERTERPSKPALLAGGAISAIVPQSIEESFRLSEAIHMSGMAPSGFDSPQKVMIAMLAGLEIGLPPMAAVQSVAVINNRPCIWGDALIGVVRKSPLCQHVTEWIEGEGDEMVAYCETHRKGEPRPVKMSFSVADAKKAGLWQTEARVTKTSKSGGTYQKDNDSPWYKYPKRMLQMRARAWCLRDVYADVTKGMQVREEVEDYQHVGPDNAKDVTPQPSVMQRLRAAQEAPQQPADEREGFDASFVHSETENALTGEIIDNTDTDETALSQSVDAGMKPAEGEVENPPAASPSNLSADQLWLLNTTRMLWGATKAGGDPEVFKNQRLAAMDQFPKPDDCDKRISEKANSVSRHCREIIDGSLDPVDGLAVIAGIVGVDQDDILRQAGAA